MRIVIPGALPALPIATELARHLPQSAPVLHAWLRAGQAQAEDFDVREQGCTPFEAWQLEQAGYTPEPGLPPGAGLGPLHAQAHPGDEPVWLAELVHMALGTDQASLLDPELMDLQPDESHGLYASAQPLFDGTGFSAEPLAARRWRVRLPAGLRPATVSPRAVAGHPLHAWWHQDAATRPWRRLLNEIQMAWHDHPVNEARAARGAAPVNGLWLYGGARPWAYRADGQAEVWTELDAAHRAGDWAAWLEALARLDRQRLQPLARAGGLPAGPVELLLLGADRRVRLTLKPRAGLLRWLPAPKRDWNTWWSHPVSP
ncbi:hypothetical protein [Bordetella sp. 2513F-2]